MRRALVSLLTALGVVATTGTAGAAWQGPGAGSVFSRAESVPAGEEPAASVSGRNVTVSWGESTFSGGSPVEGYVVRRYDGSGTAQAVGADCSGTVTALGCTEVAVPPGSWRYAVTPRHAGWVGSEGARSVPISVDPPSLSLSPSNPKVLSLPSTLSGSIASLLDGETVRFHLDGAGGPELSGTVDGNPTPAPVPSGGLADVTVTIPAGASDGPHTVHAVASPSGESASATFVVNAAPPALTALEMFDVNQNGRIDRVIATFSDDILCDAPCTSPWTLSNVPSGGSLSSVSVTAKQATLTLAEGTGARSTAVGSFTVALAAGPTRVRDADGNQSSFPATAPADRAGPVPIGATDTNGATDGKMEAGDTATLTFSEAISPGSVPGSTTVTEADSAGSDNDTLTVTGLTNGALDTGSNGYIRNDGSSASFSPSTLSRPSPQAIRVTVGGACSPATGPDACATNVLAGGPGTIVFRPAPTLTDAAGNSALGSLSIYGRIF